MNITNISKGSNVILSPQNNNNNVIKAFEKQKEQLQYLMQKTRESKMDDKQKQDNIKELQEQIRQIDMEIQKKRSEKLNQNRDNAQGTADSQTSTNMVNDDSSKNGLSGVTDLLQATSSYSNAKLLLKTKKTMQNNIQITKTEIKLDGFTTTYKEKSIEGMESKIKSLGDKFSGTVRAAQEHIEESSKNESNERSKSKNENKIESTFSTSNSKEPKAQNAEVIDNSGEISNNQEPTRKKVTHLKVDIKI